MPRGDPRKAPFSSETDRVRLETLRQRVLARGWDELDLHAPLEGKRTGEYLNRLRLYHRIGKLPEWAVAKLEALPGWNWAPVDREMRERIDGLRRFLIDHTWDDLGPSTTINDIPIGQWVYRQRRRHAWGIRSEPRDTLLESLPGWSWRHPRSMSARGRRVMQRRMALLYQERAQQLRDFVREHGWKKLTTRTTQAGVLIGEWFVKALRLHRKGTMPPGMRAALQIIPGWVTASVLDPIARRQDIRALGRVGRVHARANQEAWLSHLKSFLVDHDLAQVNARTVFKRRRLGLWIVRCRIRYREGTLAQWLARELARLPGWTWSPNTVELTKIIAALRVIVKNGNWDALRKRPVRNGVDLHSWVMHQRRYYHKGTLSRAYREQLETLPGWSWGKFRPRRFDKLARLEALEDVYRRHGPTWPASACSPDGANLLEWAGYLRGCYQKGRLTQDTIRRLEALPGWSWKPVRRDIRFTEMLERVASYTSTHGWDSISGSTSFQDVKIGRWLIVLRSRHARGRLKREHANRLKALPGFRWDFGKRSRS